MPKFVTPAMRDMLNEQFATSPTIVVGINWGGGTTYYSTKTVLNAGLNCRGVIKSIGEITNAKRADNSGSTGSVNVEFFDKDGQFKDVIDITELEGTSATVFQHFDGLQYTDWLPLLHGRVVNAKWSEGERTFSCTIEARVISNEVGFAPTPEDFPDLSPEAFGTPWPLLFGEVTMSPCVHVRRKAEGELKTDIRLSSSIYKISDNKLDITWVEPNEVHVKSHEDGVAETTDEIYINGGSRFPQGQTVQIVIEKVIFEGKFSGDTFTVSKSNVAKYEDLALAQRPSADPDKDNFNVLWLKTDQSGLGTRVKNIVGCHVYYRTTTAKIWYNYCVKQVKDKCFFKYPFLDPTTYKPTKMLAPSRITKVFPIEPGGLEMYITDKVYNYLASVISRRAALTVGPTIPVFGFLINRLEELKITPNAFWKQYAGTKVRLYNAEDPDIYVVSLVQISEILAVYGKKKVRYGKHEVTTFAPIPKQYYEEDLTSNYQIKGNYVSALIFPLPLSDYDTETEKWESVVYVSAVSTVGPNTSEIIRYLLQTYTDYVVDDHSFDTVAGLLPYDSSFGIYDRKDTLQVCQEIAWQARCAILVDSTEIVLKYLAPNPTSSGTLDDDLIQYKSVELSTTDPNAIVTRLVGTWRETQEWSEPPTALLNPNRGAEVRDIIRAMKETQRREQPATNIALYEANQDKYGVRVKTVDIFIYNFEEAAQATIDFWGLRYSRSWRLVTLKTVLPAIQFQIYDAVQLATAKLGGAPVKCLIEETHYDSKGKDITMKLWLPIEAGAPTPNSEVWE